MSDTPVKYNKEDTGVLRTTTFGLIGRQSVRATFRLSEACIDAIQILAVQLGIKQKSLFDHLVEDTALLEAIAREARKFERDRPQRIQKTFVISRRSLVSLDSIARAFETPRDALVEISIQRLLPVIQQEQEKHRQRKQLLRSVKASYTAVDRLLQRVVRTVGQTDPMTEEVAAVTAAFQTAIDNMTTLIEKGESIERFDLEAFEAETQQ